MTLTGDILPPAALPNGGSGLSPTGSGSQADPWVYTFTTANGMDMGVRKFYTDYTADNRNIRLDLNGGSITAAASGGAYIYTNFSMITPAVNSMYAADVNIQNAGSIRIGKLCTYEQANNVGGGRGSGNVTIGSNTTSGRADRVEITAIDAGAYSIYSVTIPAGNVTVYGKNDVLIWDGLGLYGNIAACAAAGRGGRGGAVTVWHDGNLCAGEIFTYCDGASTQPAGAINLNGDVLGNGASGDLNVTALKAYANGGDGARGGSITVAGYGSVGVTNIVDTHGGTYGANCPGGAINVSGGSITIGSLDTRSPGINYGGTSGNIALTSTNGAITITGNVDTSDGGGNNGGNTAGNVTITAAGDIAVAGTLNLYAHGTRGALAMTNTSPSAVIRLASLDLGNMRSAVLYAGRKHSGITGALLGFPTGTPDDGKLDAVPGQKIHYDSGVSGNAYLAGATYTLKSGGILLPGKIPGKGTVIVLR
ncbi:MAG: hypothetical protein C0404_10105 [Verrucomicrobia bacterium]|nr:hypothetical protein [Verrucomicrobiota bacterium]